MSKHTELDVWVEKDEELEPAIKVFNKHTDSELDFVTLEIKLNGKFGEGNYKTCLEMIQFFFDDLDQVEKFFYKFKAVLEAKLINKNSAEKGGAQCADTPEDANNINATKPAF